MTGQDSRESRHRIALLTHGFEVGGGVPAVTRWMFAAMSATERYDVEILDLATSRSDANSRRLVRPRTWTRRSLRAGAGDRRHDSWGANAVELEFMRYRPRRELTRYLEKYDLLQVVSGTPAWAAVTRDSSRPVVLQAATTAVWERREAIASQSFPRKSWTVVITSRTTAAERVGLACSDVVMVENRTMLKRVQESGHRRVVLAPPGIDTDAFRPAAGGRSRHGHILAVCRLGDPRKRLDRLVKAYRDLVDADPAGPPLVLAGKGVLHRAAADQISRSGLGSRVRVMSDVPHNDLRRLYQEASVFVQTSQEEGLGLTLLEAMACGVPVVATETAGSRETVDHGETGFLVPQDDESAIAGTVAGRVIELLGPLGDRFALRGRERCVSMFSTTVTLDRYLHVYSSLLAGPRTREDRADDAPV
jgi:glycosyltransferase involved in cell wall biosynthesis